MIVQRAGDVIPQIVGPAGAHRKGTRRFKMPTHCPLCDVEIVKPEGEVMHRCPNRACPSRGLETLNNWVMAAADIEGVGEQLVRRLWDLGLLRSLPDLYRLTKEQLLELDGFQEKSATNVVSSIEASKQIPFRRVLFGLEHPRRRLGDGAEPRAPLRLGRPARGRRAGGHHRGRGPRARARGEDRRVVRGGGQQAPRGRAARARPPLRVRRGGPSARRPAHWPDLRHHGDARGLVARRGPGRARGSRREGHGLRLQEDDGPHRRRGARRVQADEGSELRRAAARRSRARPAYCAARTDANRSCALRAQNWDKGRPFWITAKAQRPFT